MPHATVASDWPSACAVILPEVWLPASDDNSPTKRLEVLEKNIQNVNRYFNKGK